MKRITATALSLIIAFSFCITAYAKEANILTISNEETWISSAEYGINLVDAPIHALSSNLVENGSFEDMDNGWEFPAVDYVYGKADSMGKNNKTYNVIAVNGSYLLKNKGYSGMGFKSGEKYYFSCFAKNIDFEGNIFVWLDSDKNSNNITQLSTSSISKLGWSSLNAVLESVEDATGMLTIYLEGTGSLELDCVRLIPENSYGFDKEGWKNASLRSDSFTAIQNLNPSFIRFSLSKSWKTTLGPKSDSTSEIGAHEFLQLSDDLSCNAIPYISSGNYKMGSNKFNNYKQDILDFIEYATADATTSYYGALRAANGSYEPFMLKYVQLADGGTGYSEIKSAIEKKYSNITILGENDIELISNNESTMLASIQNASQMLGVKSGFVAYEDTFNSFIELAPNEISYSPTYYAQMLFANNHSDSTLNFSYTGGKTFNTAVYLDKTNNAIYVKAVNGNASPISFNLNLNGFDGIGNASVQTVSSKFSNAENTIGKQYISPTEKTVDALDRIKLPAYSVNVIRISYSDKSAETLFSLPVNIDYSTKNYIPAWLIIIIIAAGLAVPVGTVIGLVLYKRVISKKKKKRTVND